MHWLLAKLLAEKFKNRNLAFLANTGVGDMLAYELAKISRGFIIDSMTFKYRRKITITEQSGNNLSDYQVRIDLDATNFDFSHAQTNGEDIRFTDASGNLLDYWIEEWDAVNETAKVWVKVPSIPANGMVEIFVYYGNSEITNASDGEATFELYLNFSNLTMLSESTQDVDGNGEILDGGRTFHTWGNSWKVFTGFGIFSVVGDGSQRLDLKIKSPDTGEILGVKFDTDAQYDSSHGYQFAGSQSYWGTPDQSYTNSPNWQDCYAILDDFSISADYIHLPIDDDADSSGDVYYKDVRIRKYTSPEPSISVGVEETA